MLFLDLDAKRWIVFSCINFLDGIYVDMDGMISDA